MRPGLSPRKGGARGGPGPDTLRFGYSPLDPVHPNARLAAEAAGAQGRFWEMHDLLYSNQDRLFESDLLRHAAPLGLDAGRFERDLASRRHARWADEEGPV